MHVTLQVAALDDVAAIAALRTAVAEHLTARFERGPWSMVASERGVLSHLQSSRVYVARNGREIVATLRLATKKPWAIDASYFSPVRRALYLTDMAVSPSLQRRGVGRECLEGAKEIARAWPGDAIRLDAYDADAGAGDFYAKCGFRERGRVSYRGVPLIYFEHLVHQN